MNVITSLSLVNIVLVIGLLYVYLKNFIKMRSFFTAGLLVFAALFLVQNVMAFYFMVTMMPYYASAVEPFMVVFTMLQLVAFAVLNYITWR